MTGTLDRFAPATRQWFDESFDAPTPAQLGAWDARRRRRARPGGRPDRFGQDTRGLPVVDRPAHARRRVRGHTRALHLPAQGAGGRRRAQPPLPARRHHPGRGPARRRVPRGHGRRTFGRHHPARPPSARDASARHPHHDARVAVPHAHLGGARDPAHGRDRHRRRDPRRRRHQARRAPRPVTRTPRRPAGRRRLAASASARPSARTTRSPASSAVPRASRSWLRSPRPAWRSRSRSRSTT